MVESVLVTRVDAVEEMADSHQRIIFGANGQTIGLLERMRAVERFIEEVRLERKEAHDDRRKIMVGVITAIAIEIAMNIALLLYTHPGTLNP